MNITQQQFNNRFEELNPNGSNQVLANIQAYFLEYFKDLLPYVYPFFGDNSGIFCEWDLKNEYHRWDASIDINLETEQGYFHALNSNNEKEIELTLDLKERETWKQLHIQILNLLN